VQVCFCSLVLVIAGLMQLIDLERIVSKMTITPTGSACWLATDKLMNADACSGSYAYHGIFVSLLDIIVVFSDC